MPTRPAFDLLRKLNSPSENQQHARSRLQGNRSKRRQQVRKGLCHRNFSIESLEPRYLLSLPADLAFDASSGLVAEGEGTPATAALSRLYEGLLQLDAFGRRLEDAAATIAPLPTFMDQPLLTDGLGGIVDIAGVMNNFTSRVLQPPSITFADGNSSTAPDFGLASPLTYFVSLDGESPQRVTASPPNPLPGTVAARLTAWTAQLNSSLLSAGLNDRLQWNQVSVDGEPSGALQLRVRDDIAISRLQVTTTAITGSANPIAFGQPASDLQFSIDALSIRSDQGTGGSSPPIVLPNYSVSLPRSAPSSDPLKTNDNVSARDLADDLNRALAKIDVRFPSVFEDTNTYDPTQSNRNLGTYLEAIVVNVGSNERLALVGRTGSVQSFGLSGPGLGALGFTSTSVNDRLLPAFTRLFIDSQAATPGVDPVLLAQVESGAKTIEQAATEVLVGLGIPTSLIGFQRNSAGQPIEVTFPLQLTQTQVTETQLDLSRNVNVPGVGLTLELAAEATAAASTEIDLDLRFGVSLVGDDQSPIVATTELRGLNSNNGLQALVGLAGAVAIPNANLTSSLRFTVSYRTYGNPSVTTSRVVSVSAAAAADNTAKEDLIEDINQNLDAQGLGELIEAALVDGKFHLRSIGGDINYLELRSTNAATSAALGLRAGSPPPNVVLRSTDRPNPLALPITGNQVAYPDLVIEFGASGSGNRYFINLDGSVTVGDAVSRINAQVATANFASVLNGRLVLRANTPFRVVDSRVGSVNPGSSGTSLPSGGLLSGAGKTLGIIGESQANGSTHELLGASPDRLDLADRVYIMTNGTGPALGLNVDVSLSALSAGVSAGMASLYAELERDENSEIIPPNWNIQLGLNLKDPGTGSQNDNRITFEELMRANPADLFSLPTLNLADVTGSIVVKGELFGGEGGGAFAQQLDTAEHLLKLDFATGSTSDLRLELSSAPNFAAILSQLEALRTEDVVSGLVDVVRGIFDPNSLSGRALATELPLLSTTLGSAIAGLNELDGQLQKFVSSVNVDAFRNSIASLESAISNLPVDVALKNSIRGAAGRIRNVVHEVDISSAEQLTTQVSRLISTVALLEREIARIPGVGNISGGSEGESSDTLIRELLDQFDSLKSLLPTINNLSTRIAEVVRDNIPALAGVEFKFDILPDFDSNSSNGEHAAVLIGLLLPLDASTAINPQLTQTSLGPLRIELDGDLQLQVAAELGIGLAIVLPSSGNSLPQTHILVDPPSGSPHWVKTMLSVEAQAVGSLAASAGFGSTTLVDAELIVALSDGEVGQPAGTGNAAVLFEFQNGTGPLGSRPLDATLFSDLQGSGVGSFNGALNVELLGQSVPNAATIAGTIQSLIDGTLPQIEIDEPALSELLNNIEFDLQTIIAGANLFLDQLQSLLREHLSEVPFIGEGLEDLGGLIEELRVNLVDRLQTTLEDLEITTLEDAKAALKNAVFSVLNAGTFVKLRDYPGTSSSITLDDIHIDLTRDLFEIEAFVGIHETFSEGYDFDTNFAGLPLAAEGQGGVELDLQVEAFVGLGIGRLSGFYLIGKDEGHRKLIDDAEVQFGDELAIRVNADLQIGAEPSELTLDLFLIEMAAIDAGSLLAGTIGINLGAGNIALTEIAQQENAFHGTGDVELALDLEASLLDLPRLQAELRGGWSFSFDEAGIETETPTLALNNIQLDMGHYIRTFIGGAADAIRDILEPIRPVIQLLRTEVPGVSQLSRMAGQGPVTLLDLALLEVPRDTARQTRQFLTFVDALDRLQNRLPSDGIISFGSISFGSNTLLTPDWNLLAGNSISIPAMTPPDLGSLASLIAEFERATDEVPRAPTAGSEPADGLGLAIPILDDPVKLIQLLLGQTVELIDWDIPVLELEFAWSQSFPVIPTPPINVEVGVNAGFSLDLGVGFDSRGLATGNFLDGFYINDMQNGIDIDELIFSLGASVAALLDVGIASAGIKGEIVGSIKGNWNDPDRNGKLYVDEILHIIDTQGVGCLVDLSAELRANLALVWEVLFFDGSIEIVDLVLFDESNKGACPAQVPAHLSNGNSEDDDGRTNILPTHVAQFYGASAPGGIAPAGTLIIHAGNYANLRVRGSSTDTSETFTLTKLAPGVVRVEGMGMEATYGGVTSILFDGGSGDDTLNLRVGENGDELSYRTFDIRVIAFGGDANDSLQGGALFDSMFGGPGTDLIVAGPGDDYVSGGDGNDSIYGDDGQDTLIGGSGNDTIVGEGGTDIIEGQTGNDTLWGGYLNNAATPAGRAVDSIDVMDGGNGNDFIYGGPGNDRMWGRGGNDRLEGNDGDDHLDGGDAHDYLNAGPGNDPWVHGGLGNDFVMGGDGSDALLGGWGNDVILGHILASTIGGTSNEVIDGGPDDDLICGTNGVDSIFGGTSVLGYNGVATDFPAVPFDALYALLPGGYSLDSCVSPEPPPLPTPLPGAAIFRVFGDNNRSGSRNSNEDYQNDWLVRIVDSDGALVGEFLTADVDLNADGHIDATTERGLVQVPDLEPGTYRASLVLPSAVNGVELVSVTAPNLGPDIDAFLQITVSDGASVDGGEFGIFEKTLIQGFVWSDVDGDGNRDAGEPGLAGQTVYLDQSPMGGDGNYQLPQNGQIRELAAETAADGSYTIAVDGNPGEYYFRLADSTRQTFPRPVVGYGSETFAGAIVGPEWAPARGSGSPGGIAFAGEYGSEEVSFTLSDIPDHELIRLEFDLYVIGPWVGDLLTASARDAFQVQVLGSSSSLLLETFSNGGEFTNGQTYDGIPGSNNLVPAFTGDVAARRNELQFLGRVSSAYRFAGTNAFVFEHFGPLTITVRGLNLEAGKTWGLDHVKVTTLRAGHLVDIDYLQAPPSVNFGVGQNQVAKIGDPSQEKPGRRLLDAGDDYVVAGPVTTIATGTGFISGIRFDDSNQDGVLQSSEQRIARQTIYVDINGNGEVDNGEPQTLTNEAGEYRFELPEGTYTIREILPVGYEETAPPARPIAISQTGSITEVDPASGEIVHTRPIQTDATITQWIGLTYDPIEQVLLAAGNRSSGNTLLFELDPISAEATLRIELDRRLSEGDIAIQPSTGRLLAVTSVVGDGSYLVEINSRSGSTTNIARFQTEFEGGATDPSAMTFSAGGSLYVLDRNYAALYRLSTTTGEVLSRVTLTKSNLGRVAGMVWHSSSLRLVVGSPSSTFIPADDSPGLYQVSTAGTVTRINLSPTPLDLSGMTLVPNMGHTVTLVADEFDRIAPAINRHFGNIPVQYIYDGKDYVEGHGNNDTIYGDNLLTIPRTITIGDDDELVGGLGADTINGQDKEDTIWGGTNTEPNSQSSVGDNDTLDGGEGFNRLVQWALGSQTLTDTALTGQGTDAHTRIYLARLLAGANGVTLNASAFSLGSVELIGGPANDTLRGGTRNDRIEGSGGNDLLDGNQGNDVYVFDIDTNLGADTFTTDATSVEGMDTLDFSSSELQRAFVDLNVTTTQNVARDAAGVSTGNLSLTLGTAASGEVIENIIGGVLDDDLRGNNASNRITGGPGSDLMFGRDGNDIFVFLNGVGFEDDRVDGQADNDALDFSGMTSDQSLIVDLRTASSSTIPIATMNNRQLRRANASFNPEQLIGTPGDDVFYDGAGSSTYLGLNGDDHYVIFNNLTGDTVVESPDGGTDHVDFSSVTVPLRIDLAIPGTFFGMVNTSSPFVPNLPLGDPRLVPRVIGSSVDFENVTGGSGIDDIFGNNSNNVIDGGPGADRLTGRQGDDTYVYRSFTATGSDETIVEATGEGNDSISFGESSPVTNTVTIDLGNNIASVGGFDVRWSGGNIENAIGGSGNDNLIGSTAGNRLVGGPGNDTLDGFYGSNLLIGGAGNDSYLYRELFANPVGGGLSQFVPDFGRIFDPDIALDSRGNPLLNAAGQPTIVDGGLDRIVLSGLAFAPIVQVDLRGSAPMIFHTDTRPAANAGANFRQVIAVPASIDSMSYPTWIENVTGSDVGDIIFGNERGNTIDGAGGNDTIYGLAGNDVLTGGSGTNTLYGGQGDDRYHFNWQITSALTSNDTLIESSDTVSTGLLASAGSDTLDFSNAPGTGTFTFNLSTFSNSSTTTSSTPRSGTTIRLRDAVTDSVSQGRAFENLIGDINQPNSLTGNESANILIGGSSADVLNGNNGRDILVGLGGVDALNGQSDDDILIGGWVDFVSDGTSLAQIDREMAALIAILREWTSSAPFANRQTAIRAGVGSSTLNARLSSSGPNPTVIDDAVSDNLSDAPATNWLIEPGFGNAFDVVKRKQTETKELPRSTTAVLVSAETSIASDRKLEWIGTEARDQQYNRNLPRRELVWAFDWLDQDEEEEELIELLAREQML